MLGRAAGSGHEAVIQLLMPINLNSQSSIYNLFVFISISMIFYRVLSVT